MDAPRIQYAKTSDGVSIAFRTLGEGPPLVCVSTFPWSHIELEWQIPEVRRWEGGLAQDRKVIRYDHRGMGLSQHDVDDFSIDGHIRDLEAVVASLEVDRFALFAGHRFGLVATTYAARHPERLSHLILWHTSARVADFESQQNQAVADLLDKDWELYTETLAHMTSGWSGGEEAHRRASVFREATTPELVRRIFSATSEWDVTSLLSEVKSPTLVLRRREFAQLGPEVARNVASRIPNARLVMLEGTSSVPHAGDTSAVLRTIHEFLSDIESQLERTPDLPSGTAIILFADIVDSTALTERLGDAAFRKKARELDGVMRGVIRDNGGTPIEGKLLGDGVLAVFTSARQAIEAALSCGERGGHAGLPLHLGLHAGDVIRESDPDGRSNVYGGAVNIASRISGLSAPGEVLVSDTVRSLARTSAGVAFEDRGEQSLKGVGEPVRVWAVREGGAAGAVTPTP
jgi:class 3 adenylate cyclase